MDYILCEDTRVSIKLLNHLNINNTLISFNKDNEHEKYHEILSDLLASKNIALISDAGTPGISDPGHILINACIQNNIKTQSLPGATAFVPALVNSGMDTTSFTFYGFLKNRNEKKKQELSKVLASQSTIILYESPYRVKETLELISQIDNMRYLCVAREISKIHEEYLYGKAEEILPNITEKGEFVIIIDKAKSNIVDFTTFTLEEHYNYYKVQGYEKKEIIKKISTDLNVHKSEIYKLLIDFK